MSELPSSPEAGQSEDGQPSSDCPGSVVIIEEIVTTPPTSSSRQVAGSVESSFGSHVMDVMHGCAVTSTMHDSDEGPVAGTPGTIARSMLRASGPGELVAGTSGAGRAAAEGTEALGAEVPEAARLRALTSSTARSSTSSTRAINLGLGPTPRDDHDADDGNSDRSLAVAQTLPRGSDCDDDDGIRKKGGV